jgi:hypothetical protein
MLSSEHNEEVSDITYTVAELENFRRRQCHTSRKKVIYLTSDVIRSLFCDQLCDQNETVHHLFFSCPAAKYVWSCVASFIGAPSRPGNFSQFFLWFPQFVPASQNVRILGIASICWPI